MNRLKYLYLGVCLTATLTACYEVPLDSEQYKKEVYIVKSDKNNYLYNIDVKFQRQESPAYVTIGCSGSLPPDEDILVRLKVDTALLDDYNASVEDGNYKTLIPEDCFRLPSYTTVIPAGEIKSVIPVYFNTNKMTALDNYVLPLSIESVSAYTVKEEIAKIVLGIRLVSEYSGTYGSVLSLVDQAGVFENTEKEKELTALTETTLRMYAGREDEVVKEVNNRCMLLRINPDNTVNIESYGNMEVWELSPGTYDPETGCLKLNYRYTDTSGKVWTVDEVLTKK